MNNRKQTKEHFASYLRENKKAPSDWEIGLFGEFPSTQTNYQKYFGKILEENTNQLKIQAIEAHYKLDNDISLKKKIELINGRPRSIVNFYNGDSMPYESGLKFIALVFEYPIKTLEQYVVWQKEQKENELKEEAKKKEQQEYEIKKQAINNIVVGLKEEAHKKEEQIKPKEAQKTTKVGITGWKKIITKFIALPIGFLLILFFTYSIVNNIYNQNINKNSVIPKYVGSEIFVNNSGDNEPAVHPDSVGLLFAEYHTVNIFNDKFIFTNNKWKFVTDPNGEDMNSKYGTPYNETITELSPTQTGSINIANQKIDINFNIENTNKKNLYFSGYVIKIISTFDAKANKAEYNLYKSMSHEMKLSQVEFLDDKKAYSFQTDKELIKSGNVVFCKIPISIATHSYRNKILEFEIIIDLVDKKSNHYEIKSDKTYFIANLK